MKFRFMGLLAAFLASFLLLTTMAIAQDTPPSGPGEAAPSATDEVKAEAAPATIQPHVYAGGHKGGWLIFAPISRGTFQDYSNPPRYYASSMKFAGTLGAYWVFNLEGFAGPPQFAIQSTSTTASFAIYYRSAPNQPWQLFDTTGRGVALGNLK